MRERWLFRLVFLCVILFLAGFSIEAQSGIQDLYSPNFLAAGANSTSLVSPSGDVLNPAASGGKQNTTIDFSYISLVGLSGQQIFGHAINAGVTVPTPVGVFSGSGRFVSSPFDGVYRDTFGALNFSFAKDLYRDFYVGAGLGFQVGSDWGLGLDLGFLHLPGALIEDSVFFQDFRWGFSMRGMGKGYVPPGAQLPSPPSFTPAIAASLTLLKTDIISVTLAPDVSFPAFQDVRINVGAEISVLDSVFLRSGYAFDLSDTLSGAERQIPFSFGAAIKFPPAGRKDKIEDEAGDAEAPKREQDGIAINLAAAPLQGDVWGFGLGVNIPLGSTDNAPPVIETDTIKRYISPNYDGAQDELIIPLSITDERYVRGYRFIVKDDAGNTVRTIKNKEDRPENKGIQDVFARFAAVKQGIPVPENLRWDGKSDAGLVVPDGTYYYMIESWDDNENLAQSDIGEVTVDNTYPGLFVKSPYLVFSPNADGRQDTLIVEQTGSEEDLWLVLRLDGETGDITEYRWENAEPMGFQWDG